jgi:hypothetical protein
MWQENSMFISMGIGRFARCIGWTVVITIVVVLAVGGQSGHRTTPAHSVAPGGGPSACLVAGRMFGCGSVPVRSVE